MAPLGQPAPDLRSAGSRRYKVRTGAKTATKAQEREFLDRFRRLSEDSTLVLPKWTGAGRSPFASLAKKLEHVRARHAAKKSLKGAARKKSIAGAYAAALMVLEHGKIASFASIPVGKRTVRFVMRGGARRHHHAAVQNFSEADALMLGYLEIARKRKAAFWVTGQGLVATGTHDAAPEGFADALFGPAGLAVEATDEVIRCRHAADGAWHVTAAIKDIAQRFEFCRSCLTKMDGRIEHWVTGGHLSRAPPGTPRLGLGGLPFELADDAFTEAAQRLVADAEAATREHADRFENFSNLEFLDWGREQFTKALEEREQGFLLVGDRLWLDDFDRAATEYAASPEEEQILAAALAVEAPHVRAADASLNKILGSIWPKHAEAILQNVTEASLSPDELKALVRGEPADAPSRLARVQSAAARFADFPRFEAEGAPIPLSVALRAGQLWHSGRTNAFRRHVEDAATQSESKIIALALARAGGTAAGIEWRYTPDERQAADFLTSYARMLLDAEADGYATAVEETARAVGAAPPARKD